MAGDSDYHRGDMNIAEQSATYELVMGMTKWGSLAISSGLFFFVLLFCTKTGFFGSAISAVVMLVIGIVLLRAPKADAAH